MIFLHPLFGVQIHNIPLNRINKDNAVKLGNFIGSFVRFDEGSTTSNVKSFMRVYTLINVKNWFKIVTFIKREYGSTLWMPFKYERLSNFCYRCIRLGNVVSGCCKEPMSSERELDP